MTKMQKIWFGIFLAMFVVPEILWSPVGNSIYKLSQTGISGGTHPFRMNFLENSDNINILSFVLGVQFLGLLLALIYLIVIRKQFQTKTGLWVGVAILLLLATLTFFVFGLSVFIRSIGL